MPTRPKYSVILPTLNGAECLAVTLPEMLKTERSDIEWVIGDNLSDDGTADLVRGLDDPRARLVQPTKRLTASENLENTYLRARGEWQGHIGDDDILFPSRFEMLDAILSGTESQVVITESVRYYWSDYPNSELANTLTGRTYSGAMSQFPGHDLAVRMLNTATIHGGGSWTVNRSVIDKVREKCGYFASPRHVEFFAMRAACALANQVTTVDLPLHVQGLHAKSSGSQSFRPVGESDRSTWDPSFEFPDPWEFCVFHYDGYVAISFDAALTVKAKLQQELSDVAIDWLKWTYRVKLELDRRVRLGRLSPVQARRVFQVGLSKLPLTHRIIWRIPKASRVLGLAGEARKRARTSIEASREDQTEYPDRFGWPNALHGRICFNQSPHNRYNYRRRCRCRPSTACRCSLRVLGAHRWRCLGVAPRPRLRLVPRLQLRLVPRLQLRFAPHLQFRGYHLLPLHLASSHRQNQNRLNVHLVRCRRF